MPSIYSVIHFTVDDPPRIFRQAVLQAIFRVLLAEAVYKLQIL